MAIFLYMKKQLIRISIFWNYLKQGIADKICFLKAEFIPNFFSSYNFSSNLLMDRNIFQKICLWGATKSEDEKKRCIS